MESVHMLSAVSSPLNHSKCLMSENLLLSDDSCTNDDLQIALPIENSPTSNDGTSLDCIEDNSKSTRTENPENNMIDLESLKKTTFVPFQKHNNRLQMTQHIELKLKEHCDGIQNVCEDAIVNQVGECSSHSTDSNKTDVDSTMNAGERKVPLIGSVRKSLHSKQKRSKRPPWLCQPQEDDETPEETNEECDIRDKLLQQIHSLRSRKDDNNKKLVDITNVPLIEKPFEKRLIKVEDPEASPHLGIKIVNIVGGTETNDVLSEDVCINEPLENNEKIINNHLDMPLIKLSKTKDYTKIKGWNRKKILADHPICSPLRNISNVAKKDIGSEELEPIPSCSYQVDHNIEVKQEKISNGNIFASNSLDGFLDEQRNLNISYPVPTCESTNDNIDLLDNSILVDLELERKNDSNDKDESYESIVKEPAKKARTLAEKRKLLLKEERRSLKKARKAKADTQIDIKVDTQNDTKFSSSHSESDAQDPPILEVLKEEPFDYQETVDEMPENLIKVQNRSNSCYNTGTIIYKKIKKLTVKCRESQSMHICETVKDIKRKHKFLYVPKDSYPVLNQKKKPSICVNKNQEVSYKPGPLCRKNKLQVNHCSKWKTIIKTLPKIRVDVYPELGKKIHQRAAQFVKLNNKCLSNDNVDFALTALMGSNQSKSVYTFPVPYAHNQEQVLVRQLAGTKTNDVKNFREHDRNAIRREVKKVVADLLTYVEIKELEPSLNKFENEKDKSPCKSESARNNDEDKTRPTRKRNRKQLSAPENLNLEINKPSVKVLNLQNEIPIEENNVTGSEGETCSKDFCKLGCVCSSLSGGYPASTRCKEPGCCFGCTCGHGTISKKKTSNDNALSEKNIKRLGRGHHVKSMAKEEKQFAQTAVLSKNKTVCLSVRESKRRPKYNFKKYAGFEASCSNDELGYFKRLVQSDVEAKFCTIDVVKCDFSNLVPLCLAHGFYDCHCEGKGYMEDLVEAKTFDVTEERTSERTEGKSEKVPSPAARIPDLENYTSRQIPKAGYSERNKSHKYKIKMARKLEDDVTVNAEVINRWSVLAALDHAYKPTKRRTKATKSKPTNESKTVSNTLKKILAMLVKKNEIFAPTAAISSKFYEMINLKEKSGPPRFYLFLWDTMIKLYELKILNIWYTRENNKLKFVITASTDIIPNYLSVREVEQKTEESSPHLKVDFIRWIVNRSNPVNKEKNDVLVILRIADTYWEVCGICAKNNVKKKPEDKDDTTETTEKSKRDITNNPENAETTSEITKPTNATSKEAQAADSYKTVKQVIYIKDEYTCKVLHVSSDDGDEAKVPTALETLTAQLPLLKYSCKWRMIKLNSNFSVLSLKRNSFRIKYSDLITVLKVAAKHSKTLRINNSELSQNYMHKQFGIYVTPNYNDRIFIGPYFKYENHDVETLRFVNNVLVNTDMFNTMTGVKENHSNGIWYNCGGRKQPDTETVSTNNVIDLTDLNDDEETTISTDDLTISTKTKTTSEELLQSIQNSIKLQKELSLQTVDPVINLTTRPDLEITLADDTNKNNLGTDLKTANSPSTEGNFVSINALQNATPQIPFINRHHFLITNNKIIVDIPKIQHLINTNGQQGVEILSEKSEKTVEESPEKCVPIESLKSSSDEAEEVIDHVIPDKRIEYVMRKRLMLILKNLGKDFKKIKGAKPVYFDLNFTDEVLIGYKVNKKVTVAFPNYSHYRLIDFANAKTACKILARMFKSIFLIIPESFTITVSLFTETSIEAYLNKEVLSNSIITSLHVIGEYGCLKFDDILKSIPENGKGTYITDEVHHLEVLAPYNQLNLSEELKKCIKCEREALVKMYREKGRLLTLNKCYKKKLAAIKEKSQNEHIIID